MIKALRPLSEHGLRTKPKAISIGTGEMNHKAKNVRRDFYDDGRNNRLEDLELNTGLFGDAEDLVTFAQAYYATEFPRTDALNCPPLEELREVAHSNGLPDEELREHLFNCSECFRSFRSEHREAKE